MQEPDIETLSVARAAARNLSQNSLNETQIELELKKAGFSEMTVKIIASLRKFERSLTLRERAASDHYQGLFFAGAGAVIGLMSLLAAASLGGFVLAPWGIVLVGGLLWGRARLTTVQADRLIAQVRTEEKALSYPHAIDIEKLKTADENLADQLKLLRHAQQAQRNSIYATVAMTGATVLVIVMSNIPADYFFTALIFFAGIACFGTAVIARQVFARAFGLVSPPLFNTENSTPASTVSASETHPTAYSVPKLEGLDIVSDEAVLQSQAWEGLPIMVARGGRERRKLDDGLLVFTLSGFAFLPEVQSQRSRIMDDLGKLGLNALAKAYEPIEILKDLPKSEAERGETMPSWLRTSIKHPAHFVVAWTDLVATASDPIDQIVTVTREHQGERRSFFLSTADKSLATALFNGRFKQEINAIVHEQVYDARTRQISRELMEKFKMIYGDRYEDYADALTTESSRQMMAEFDKTPLDRAAVCRQRLAPLIADYAKIPGLVQENPEFFSRRPESVAKH